MTEGKNGSISIVLCASISRNLSGLFIHYVSKNLIIKSKMISKKTNSLTLMVCCFPAVFHVSTNYIGLGMGITTLNYKILSVVKDKCHQACICNCCVIRTPTEIMCMLHVKFNDTLNLTEIYSTCCKKVYQNFVFSTFKHS